MNHNKVMLVILDGWGLGTDKSRDAIAQADTSYLDKLRSTYPSATLTTFGDEVGLPSGQMGNSEVGHLNIGAGRIVYQQLARINKAIVDDTLGQTSAIQDLIHYAKDHDKPVHLMGLLSDGGVHAHIDHVIELCHLLSRASVQKINIHAFMDGRDTAPDSGIRYMEQLLKGIEGTPARVASIIGRYYAMDRDQRWERTKEAYELLTKASGLVYTDPLVAIQDLYDQGITDEFLPAIILHPQGAIRSDDAVLFYNFRTDRPRQLVRALTQSNFEKFDMHTIPLYMVQMTEYDSSFKGVHVVYPQEHIEDTLGETIAKAGLTQLRIAETEKYPHVTFFFNGGKEEKYEGEDRIVVPSPKVATYDLQPEMSALEVTKKVIAKIKSDSPDFICLNYANADMVGHTGDFGAAQAACETVDLCLKEMVPVALDSGYQLIIIADHGNADIMINEDGSLHTAHTTNLVPIIYVSQHVNGHKLDHGKLADVSPTILHLMGIPQPALMTGQNLLS